MVKSKTAKKRAGKPVRTAKQLAVLEALQVAGATCGDLKNVQISYLRVGRRLADARDRKLYLRLGHPDMEDYAEKRLKLGRASLYRYLDIFDWASEEHKEWLVTGKKGFIPQLDCAVNLRWIENRLKDKDLTLAHRTTLEGLREMALVGNLKRKDLAPFRKNRSPRDTGAALKAFLAKFRLMRMRGSQLKSMPEEVIVHMDAAIEILKNASALQVAGIDLLDFEGLA